MYQVNNNMASSLTSEKWKIYNVVVSVLTGDTATYVPMVNTAHAYSLILRTVVVNRVCKTIPNGEIDTQPQREKSTWERERERERDRESTFP